MSEFKIMTRKNASGQGKPRVYFTCHPKDYDLYFDRICKDVFGVKELDCAIYYTEDMTEPLDENNLNTDLKRMNLLLVPVTFRLMNEPNRAMQVDIPCAKKHNIPILPFMVERDITDVYSMPENFGNRQYLRPLSGSDTEISYYDKLKKYLKILLVSEEMAKRVRAAFDAYVFLSYRKKDRQYANQLMRIIHNIPGCRDIAIWYDEFLTPGESFIANIKEAMRKSKLFTLLVTPNLLEEGNYVMEEEYPAARKMKMKILPTEMEKTDRSELIRRFDGIPEPISAEDKYFIDALLGTVRKIAVSENDSNPEHNFLIGLAYIDGIDVEIDAQRGVDLIKKAAEAGLPEAIEKLYELYFIGSDEISSDYEQSLIWANRLLAVYMDEHGSHNVNTIRALNNLAHLYSVTRNYDRAIEIYEQVYEASHTVYKDDDKGRALIIESLAYSYGELNDYERSLRLLKELYDIQIMLFGAKSIKAISTLHNIAYALFKLERFDESVDLFTEAYEKRKAKLGEDDPNTIETLNNLSVAYGRLNQHEKALELKNRVYELRCKLLGERHPDTVRSLSNLAHTYSELGDYNRAIEIGNRALKIRYEILGDEHPSTTTTMNILAVAYGRRGDLEKALELHDRVYNIRKKIFGEGHYKTVSAKKNMDYILREMGLIF